MDKKPNVVVLGVSEKQYKEMVKDALEKAFCVFLDDQSLNEFIDIQLRTDCFTRDGIITHPHTFNEKQIPENIKCEPFALNKMSYTDFCNQSNQAIQALEIRKKYPSQTYEFINHLTKNYSNKTRPVKCFKNIETDVDEQELYEIIDPIKFMENGNSQSGEYVEFYFSLFDKDDTKEMEVAFFFKMREDTEAIITISEQHFESGYNQIVYQGQTKEMVKDVQSSTEVKKIIPEKFEELLKNLKIVEKALKSSQHIEKHFA